MLRFIFAVILFFIMLYFAPEWFHQKDHPPQYQAGACTGQEMSDVQKWVEASGPRILHMEAGKPIRDTIDTSLFSAHGWDGYQQAMINSRILTAAGEVDEQLASAFMKIDGPVRLRTLGSETVLGASFEASFPGRITFVRATDKSTMEVVWQVALAIGCGNISSPGAPFTIEQFFVKQPS